MIVGTAGHTDHGKTSLVRALTGVDADRLKEEKARGLTIDLGFAYLPVENGETIGFVDAPGHEKFIRNMLAGATGIDFVLLVVAADEGVMPQTREHLSIADLLGIGAGAVALTKADAVSARRLDGAREEIGAALHGTRLAGAPIFPLSNLTGEGVEALRAFLVKAAATRRERRSDRMFRLVVDRCFALRGVGTVATGTVVSGEVRVGDEAIVSPSGLPCRVRSIHAQNRSSETGYAGQRCALDLTGEGVDKGAIRRGDVVCAAGIHAPTRRFDVKLRVLPGEFRALGLWAPVRLHHGAAEAAARIVPLGNDEIAPGEEAFAQIVVERDLAALVGDRFVLRASCARRTIGGGRIVDLRAPARKRRTPERLALLGALSLEEPEDALEAALRCAPFFLDFDGFCRDRGLEPAQAEITARKAGVALLSSGEATIALGAATFEQLKRDLLAFVAEFHAQYPDLAGIGVERLRLALHPRLPVPAFKTLLARLSRQGELFPQGAWARLPSHRARLHGPDASHWQRIAPLLGGGARFRPPRVRDIAVALALPEAEVRRLLKICSRMGQLDEIAHDHFFLRETMSELIDILVALAERDARGEITAARFRDLLGGGRKVAVQILEFLDRHGVTLRRGDQRRLNPHRLDLFRVQKEEQAARS